MADDYSVADRAQLTAESLDIDPTSYAGREADALTAMALVAGYPRMSRQDQTRILYIVDGDMGFGQSNPAFVDQCRKALGYMIVNPDWVPGSMSKADLEEEIAFWRNVSGALTKLGFSTAGAYATKSGNSVLSNIGKNLTTPGSPPGLSAITGPVRSALKPGLASGPIVFGTAAATIANSSLSDLESEAKRRGQLGTMSKLEMERFGPRQ